MLKNYLKSFSRNNKINKDHSFIKFVGPEFAVKHVNSSQYQLNLHSPKKIIHSCDYFFFLATYIYMKG